MQIYRVEVISTCIIAVCIMFGGRAILATLAHFSGVASMLLFVIAFVQGAALVRSLRTKNEVARLAASRDITALLAILFAIVAVLSRASWSIGTTIIAVEFTLVLEIMRMLTASETAV